MIERYSVKEIQEIWSDQNKYDTWLKVEQLICEAWAKTGLISQTEIDLINTKTKVDLPRMLEIEEMTKHDVVAFTRMLSEQLGRESRWVHLGITSTDIVDTAQNVMIKASNEVLSSELVNISKTLEKLSFENKNVLIMGRTHGMYGEPTSLGLKFALWFDEIQRQIQRLDLARKQIEVAKVSGSMGNYANLELEIEEYVAEQLGLDIDNISTQVTQRDRHAFLVEVFANIASTLEKITTEIRLFQRSDVNEMAEGFSSKQKGSSSMPHKKNPISSENIAGLSRYIKGQVFVALENNNLWHERDISHSSNERIILPDLYNTLIYVIRRMNNTLTDLVINYEMISKHIKEANNIHFSQRLLTYIIMNNKDVTREEVYDLIQSTTLLCLSTKSDFKELVLESELTNFISESEINEIFNNEFFLRQTDKIFKKVFAK
ncbi:adenylosuccinate lyase [[Acholeplasma] multilocale]|uniref:adenylosuccinate lyase n=1 Tax=[Acholeplasma] multilocale TaxID=264638 RepID=UPI000478A952|nr:adenylosuccinate lyase [[Acholeplasma] multilocale]